MTNRSFTEEFKEETVKQITEHGYRVSAAIKAFQSDIANKTSHQGPRYRLSTSDRQFYCYNKSLII